MKRFTCMVLSFIMMLGICLSAFAEGVYDEAVSRVSSIGIMGDTEDGDFREDDNITRAEFTTVICRLLGADKVSNTDTVFTDVPKEYWASGYIATAYAMKLINGIGDGLFAPEDNVTYTEAVKILVCALGYAPVMSDTSYPNGYVAEAGKLGITKDVFAEGTVTRAEVAALIDNTLDVYPLEPGLGTKEEYKKSEDTVLEKLLKIKDLMHYEGILKATDKISLVQDGTSPEGYITVGDYDFAVDADYGEYIGMNVNVYYDDSNKRNVFSVSPVVGSNEVFAVNALDADINGNRLEYYDGDKEKHKTIKSAAAVLLNNEPIDLSDVPDVDIGEYKLLSNDGNSSYDVVFITSAVSYIIDRVNTDSTALFFKDNKSYNGKNGISLDYDDEDNTYIIEDADGNALEFSDIKAGSAVSIIANSDLSYCRLIINDVSVEGEIETIDSEGAVGIAGNTYPVGKDDNGSDSFNAYLGLEGNFVIDAFGYVLGLGEKAKSEFTYGYIAGAAVGSGLNSEYKLQIVTGGEPVKEVKTSGGVETISYYLENNGIGIYKLADKFRYAVYDKNMSRRESGKKGDLNDISAFADTVAGFQLNADGEIDEINIYEIPTNFSSYDFNAKIFSFGGMKVSRGFIANEATAVICVPNKDTRVDDDFGVKVKITNNNSYSVYGVLAESEYEPDSDEAMAEPVNVIIVKSDMDSAKPQIIPTDSDICIIGNISELLSEDGDAQYNVELLNGSEKTEYIVPSDLPSYAQFANLRKADLIQFTTNSKNEISSVKKLASVQGLRDYNYDENLYGIIEEVDYNTYDYFDNEMIDLIKANIGNELINIKLFKDEGQNVYLYDRRTGYVYPATSDDIKSAEYYGTDASKIFAYMQDNNAEVIVLIRD